MMVVACKVEAAQTLHGCEVQGIPGLQGVVGHILEHYIDVLRSNLDGLNIRKISE